MVDRVSSVSTRPQRASLSLPHVTTQCGSQPSTKQKAGHRGVVWWDVVGWERKLLRIEGSSL